MVIMFLLLGGSVLFYDLFWEEDVNELVVKIFIF